MNEDAIDLGHALAVLRRRLLLILTITALGGALATGATYFLIPAKYRTTTRLLINPKPAKTADEVFNQTTAGLAQVTTYKDLIREPVVLTPVKQALKAQGFTPPRNLSTAVSLTTTPNSQVLTVTVATGDPYLSRALANAVVAVLQQKLPRLVANAQSVGIVARGTLTKVPAFPNHWGNLALGLLLGFLTGCVVAWRRAADTGAVDGTAFIEQELGLPLLAVIEDIAPSVMQRGPRPNTPRPPVAAIDRSLAFPPADTTSDPAGTATRDDGGNRAAVEAASRPEPTAAATTARTAAGRSQVPMWPLS
ncbi:YveK family protein [Lacticaseibacillus suihuaensis]